MAIGDLYKVVASMIVYGQECQNAFWYRQRTANADPDDDIEELIAAVQFLWYGTLDDMLTTDVSFYHLTAWNYTDGVEFATTPVAGGGSVAESALPSQYAVGCKMGRPGVGWNYPRKRISGFAADAYSGNDIDPGLSANLGLLMNAMRNVNGDGDIFEWVIIRPHSSFGLGNVVLLNEGIVGTFIDAYDATQRSRS
jgi:hypothetical protein